MKISYPDMPAICCSAADVARRGTVRRTSSSGDGAHELGTVSVASLPSHRCREQPRSAEHQRRAHQALPTRIRRCILLGPGSTQHIPPFPHPEPIKLQAVGQQPWGGRGEASVEKQERNKDGHRAEPGAGARDSGQPASRTGPDPP